MQLDMDAVLADFSQRDMKKGEGVDVALSLTVELSHYGAGMHFPLLRVFQDPLR